MAVCGAERLRDETRAFLRKKSTVTLLEGYGVTETAPVVAVNTLEENHPGKVGRLMAGMEAKLEPVEGIQGAGQLHLRGPKHDMQGYIKSDAPGVIVPPPDGWHNTGDIAAIDADGFIAIRGRLKRFAKIGGEAVSLAVVENIAAALWPEYSHAAVAVPDGRKGEKIVLLTTAPEARRLDMLSWAQNHGVAELSVPRELVLAEVIPMLATGKTDYVSVQKMVEAEQGPDRTVLGYLPNRTETSHVGSSIPPGACSLAGHIVAAEGGLALELEKVDLKGPQDRERRRLLCHRRIPRCYVPR